MCRHLTMGRIIIIILAVAGLLPLIGDAKALDATTVSGTVVLGLGPPIFALMFVDGYRPLTFHLPFWWCVSSKEIWQTQMHLLTSEHAGLQQCQSS